MQNWVTKNEKEQKEKGKRLRKSRKRERGRKRVEKIERLGERQKEKIGEVLGNSKDKEKKR